MLKVPVLAAVFQVVTFNLPYLNRSGAVNHSKMTVRARKQ